MLEHNKTPRTQKEGQSQFQLSPAPPPRKIAKRTPKYPLPESNLAANSNAETLRDFHAFGGSQTPNPELASQSAETINPQEFHALKEEVTAMKTEMERRFTALEEIKAVDAQRKDNEPDLHITSGLGLSKETADIAGGVRRWRGLNW